jgi:hydrogenase nickel incorporation protein HypA/HybF
MHEFSLAQNIVEIVTQTAQQSRKDKVSNVILEIGEIAGVEEQALLTALDSLMPGTILSGAKIEILHVAGIAMCQECTTKFEIHDLYSLCPNCNGFAKKMISGKEFNVKAIEAE